MWYHIRDVEFCDKEITTRLPPLAGLTSLLRWNDKKTMQNIGA